MIDGLAKTVDAVIANGGEMAQPLGADTPEITARFHDPAGKVMAYTKNYPIEPSFTRPNAIGFQIGTLPAAQSAQWNSIVGCASLNKWRL